MSTYQRFMLLNFILAFLLLCLFWHAAGADDHDANVACREWTEVSSPWYVTSCYRFNATGAVACFPIGANTWDCKE